MGILDSLAKKAGEAMEKSMGKNLTGASKEAYEKDKAEKAAVQAQQEAKKASDQEELASHKVKATKDELDNLNDIINKANLVDVKNIWVGGLDNFKQNQNAKFANIFSGKKNVKILSSKDGTYFLSKWEDGVFYAYKTFKKEDVYSFETEGLLSKKLKLKLKDNVTFSIDVTDNKEKLDELKRQL